MAKKTTHGFYDKKLRDSMKRILSAGAVSSFAYSLPVEEGTQISLCGDLPAFGNRSAFPVESTADALSALPPFAKTARKTLEKYASRMRFILQPGEENRFLTAASVISELTAAGFVRIVVVTDTSAERDELAAFFRVAKEGLGGAEVTVYLPGGDGVRGRRGVKDARARARAIEPLYGVLTAKNPTIFLAERHSFCRRSNLLRTPLFGEGTGRSFAELLGVGAPALLCFASSAASARDLYKAASIFSPSVGFLVCAGEERLRDAVIAGREKRQDRTKKRGSDSPHAGAEDLPEQISF